MWKLLVDIGLLTANADILESKVANGRYKDIFLTI